MAKRVKNPILVSIIKDGDEIKTTFEYGLECDDGLSMRTGFKPELTPREEDAIAQIVDKAFIKINEHEEIA